MCSLHKEYPLTETEGYGQKPKLANTGWYPKMTHTPTQC
jgi:hypothetical protein